MDNELDRKIDVTAKQFLLVQNRHQTHDWTLIGSGANGLGIQECCTNGLGIQECCTNGLGIQECCTNDFESNTI